MSDATTRRRTVPPLGATYRLQMHKEFTFDDARELVPYLERLGISHVYSSPILKARPGSTHGYDVADPTMANPELGGEEKRQLLAKAIANAGLGFLLDIVPNHMGTGSANPFWEDVLTHGVASRHGKWFDIRWSGAVESLRGHVLLPVLGDKLPKVIERGELTVALTDGRLRLAYFENDFPLDPATWPAILERALGARAGRNEKTAPKPANLAQLSAIVEALRALPRRNPAHAGERSDAADKVVGELAALLHRHAPLRRRVEAAAEGFSRGAKGAERMRALVEGQAYRLAFWRRAARLINYRRFFDINELVALRMENEEVFAAVHERVLEWVAAGDVNGLRVDHIDGLFDPLGYLQRLRREANARTGATDSDDAFPILVEKILTPGERLRSEWPVQGTTGYEFLNDLESVFIDPEGERAVTAFYHSLRPGTRRDPLDDFEEVAMRGKVRILTGSLAPDVRGLATMLLPIARRDARVRALGTARLARALTEWLACFPVYRTYIGRTPEPPAADRDVVERVVQRCTERGRIAPHTIAFLRDVMLDLDGPDRAERLRFIAKLQQTSGPATAKGVEDTALYQYVPLVSLNEVGGEPARKLDDAVQRFHDGNAERGAEWPRNLLCTNTHDTKRSADVRARLDVLAEIPEMWTAAVTRWRSMNAEHRQRARGSSAPDTNSEYLLYQTLFGIWPVKPEKPGGMPNGRAIGAIRERVEEYMLKAVKEAKLHTSWTDSNEEFENGLKAFIAAVLPSSGAAKSAFLRDVAALVARTARAGLWNSLSRIVLHLTAPGVPDLYRGDELWNFALVDPDNRRPVDFDRRASLLEEIAERYDESEDARGEMLRDLVATPEDDRLKLLVTWRALQARRRRTALHGKGSYLPLEVTGSRAAHVAAFAKRLGAEASITIAPRLTWGLGGSERAPIGTGVWGDTRVILPPGMDGALRCALAGHAVTATDSGGRRHLEVAAALNQLPVAVLESGQID